MTTIEAGEYKYWSTVTPSNDQDVWTSPNITEHVSRAQTGLTNPSTNDVRSALFDPSGLFNFLATIGLGPDNNFSSLIGPTLNGDKIEFNTSLWDFRQGQEIILYIKRGNTLTNSGTVIGISYKHRVLAYYSETNYWIHGEVSGATFEKGEFDAAGVRQPGQGEGEVEIRLQVYRPPHGFLQKIVVERTPDQQFPYWQHWHGLGVSLSRVPRTLGEIQNATNILGKHPQHLMYIKSIWEDNVIYPIVDGSPIGNPNLPDIKIVSTQYPNVFVLDNVNNVGPWTRLGTTIDINEGSNVVFNITNLGVDKQTFKFSEIQDGRDNSGNVVEELEYTRNIVFNYLTSRIEFNVKSDTPNILYYFSTTQPGMGGSMILIKTDTSNYDDSQLANKLASDISMNQTEINNTINDLSGIESQVNNEGVTVLQYLYSPASIVVIIYIYIYN